MKSALALGADGDHSSGEQQLGQRRATDREWIQAACSGDTAAFGRLVDKYQDRLCTSLLHICGTLHEAEDVAQDAFVQVHCKLHTFAGDSAFYTWLYRIAMNIAITRHRRRRKESSLDQSRDRMGGEPHDNAEKAEEKVLREERAQHVRLALEQLNAEHRTILVLREVEGCDYDTISKILELPVGTVRSRLHRARLQLRDRLVIVLGPSSNDPSPCAPTSQTNCSAPTWMASSPPASAPWWSSN